MRRSSHNPTIYAICIGKCQDVSYTRFMHVVELLNRIHASWISRITHQLARGEGVRESFQEELERFFVLLKQSVETGDPAWLVSILDEWAEARLETDSGKNR